MLVIVYSNPADPIVRCIRENLDLFPQVCFIHTSDFCRSEFKVFDHVTAEAASVFWQSEDGTEIRNTQSTLLVNRVTYLPIQDFKDFHPDDRQFARDELHSYLMFALSAFPLATATPQPYSLSNHSIPFPMQWALIQKHVPELDVPRYTYCSTAKASEILATAPQVIGDFYSHTEWRPQSKIDSHHLNQSSQFLYSRPSGKPVFAMVLAGSVFIQPVDDQPSVDPFLQQRITTLAHRCSQVLNTTICEILFFVNEDRITFGVSCSEIRNWDISRTHIQALAEFLNAKDKPSLAKRYNPSDYEIFSGKEKCTSSSTKSVLLGVSIDATMNLTKQLGSDDGSLEFLPLETFGQEWTFELEEGDFRICRGVNSYSVKSIYYRPAGLSESVPYYQDLVRLNDLISVLDLPVLGRSSIQYLNSSKPLQMVASLREAQPGGNVRLPEIRIVSGNTAWLKERGFDSATYVVKSMGGVRTKVADGATIAAWPLDATQNVPVLFQQKVAGNDVRVHICADHLYSKITFNKNYVDYRYADSRSALQDFELPDTVAPYVRNLARSESNPLMGIDFILNEEGHFHCLEANPGPAWGWFYKEQDPRLNPLGSRIINILKEGDLYGI